MATRFWAQTSGTVANRPTDAALHKYDAAVTRGGTTFGTSTSVSTAPTSDTNEKYFGSYWSDRFSQEATISGTITAAVTVAGLSPSPAQRIRVRVSKITVGGSDVETLIATGESADYTANGLVTVTMTPPAAVTVAPFERLIYRVYVYATTGTFAGQITEGSSSGNSTYVELTETITTVPNGVRLVCRRTTTIGIGNFMDAIETAGSTVNTTAVVNTVASGTEIQWTKTAGGTVAEWISPRFTTGWPVVDVNTFKNKVYASENNVSANTGLRLKLFRRQPDGTETLCATYTSALELGTSAAIVGTQKQAFSSVVPMNFAEDDRLVVRCYITNIGGTMGGGFTSTLYYDNNSALDSASNQLYVWISDCAPFKSESAPSGAQSVIPSGGSTLGVSNGQ